MGEPTANPSAAPPPPICSPFVAKRARIVHMVYVNESYTKQCTDLHGQCYPRRFPEVVFFPQIIDLNQGCQMLIKKFSGGAENVPHLVSQNLLHLISQNLLNK